MRKKAQGGRLCRSEIVQARLKPKIKFIADLFASNQGKTLSALIEEALEKHLKDCAINTSNHFTENNHIPSSEILAKAWDSDKMVRFIKMAFYFPNLLSAEDERLWQFILSTDYFWVSVKGKEVCKNCCITEKRSQNIDALIFPRLRKFWENIQSDSQRQNIDIPNK